MFTLIFAVLPIIIVGIVVGRGVAVFNKTEGKFLDRVWATSRDSATWFCGKVTWVGGWVIIGLDNFAQLFSQDEVSQLIRESLPPQWAGWALLVITLLFWASRLRTLVSGDWLKKLGLKDD